MNAYFNLVKVINSLKHTHTARKYLHFNIPYQATPVMHFQFVASHFNNYSRSSNDKADELYIQPVSFTRSI